MNSIIHSTQNEHLLYARHDARPWGYKRQARKGPKHQESLNLVRHTCKLVSIIIDLYPLLAIKTEVWLIRANYFSRSFGYQKNTKISFQILLKNHNFVVNEVWGNMFSGKVCGNGVIHRV